MDCIIFNHNSLCLKWSRVSFFLFTFAKQRTKNKEEQNYTRTYKELREKKRNKERREKVNDQHLNRVSES